jgi:hypothetical protein
VVTTGAGFRKRMEFDSPHVAGHGDDPPKSG